MGDISHRILKIGGLTIITVVTVLIFGISYATLCIIIPAASGTVYLSQQEYSHRLIRQAAAVHGRRMRNLGLLERQREWKHSSSTPPSDRTFHSSSAYNTQPNNLTTGFSQTLQPLPRMRRLNTTSSSFSSALVGCEALSRTIMTAQRRHPLAQYSNMSILPTVHLDRPSRHILSERNSRMVSRAVTVKIAPPDVLKPPTPVLLHVERKAREQEHDPCDTSTVLSAIREKRKRTLREEEAAPPATEWTDWTEWTQASKRRRQDQVPNGDGAQLPNGDICMDIGLLQAGAQKRVASPMSDSVTEDERVAKRSRRVSGETQGGRNLGETHGPRNPIDVSYSSSRRWLDRKARERSASHSRASSVVSSGSRDTLHHLSDGHSGVAGSSGTSTPRRSYGLSDDDDDEEMGSYQRSPSAADSVVRQTCARLAGHGSGQESVNAEDIEKERPGSRRTTPTPRRYDVRPHSTLIDSIVKVPHLRYDLTVEDYAADRQAEMDRVRQMLNDNIEDDSDRGTAGATVSHQLAVQPTPKTATPIKSLFATSLPSGVSTVTSAASTSQFVRPSVSQPETTTTTSAVPTIATINPVSTTTGTTSTAVPGTATISFSAGQSFAASAQVPGSSKHSFNASQSFGVTTSAPSGAVSSGAVSASSNGAPLNGATSSSATTSKSPPAYSFKPVFNVPTPPKTDATQPSAGLNTRTPTLETMLRSESPVRTPGGSTNLPGVSSGGSQPVLSASAPTTAGGPHSLSYTTPSVTSQLLVNGGTDMFKVAAVTTPTFNFGAPKKDLATSTSAPLATTSGAANNTFQFGAAPTSSAPMFGAGSAPVLNNVSSSGSMFGQKTAVSVMKGGSGVAKSLFGNTSQPTIFGSSGAATAPGGGAPFTFGVSRQDSAAPQPASVFGVAPAVNGTTSNSVFLTSQTSGTTVTFGTATSSAQGRVFQFGDPPKTTATSSFTPVFNFNQAPTQTSQLTSFGGSVNTSQSSASFTTPFKGFGQTSSAFGVDSTTTPAQTSGIFGAPVVTTPFGGSAGGRGADTFGAKSETKPFGTSSSFGSFSSGQTQPTAGAVSFGTAATKTNFQFGGSTGQSVFAFGQGQQNTAGTAPPTFSSSSSFAAPSFSAQPPGGNMFSVSSTPITTRPRTMARSSRRRVPRR